MGFQPETLFSYTGIFEEKRQNVPNLAIRSEQPLAAAALPAGGLHPLAIPGWLIEATRGLPDPCAKSYLVLLFFFRRIIGTGELQIPFPAPNRKPASRLDLCASSRAWISASWRPRNFLSVVSAGIRPWAAKTFYST